LRGKEPGETHYPAYDDDGRLVSVRVERDPEWTADQVSLVLGVEAYERSVGPHGIPINEATNPENDPDNPNGTGYFRAGVPVTDPDGVTSWGPVIDLAEKARLDRMDEYRKAAGEDGNVNGVTFPVVWVPRERRGG
jgi:hypothetical protein